MCIRDRKYPVVFEYAGQETALVQILVNEGKAVSNELLLSLIHIFCLVLLLLLLVIFLIMSLFSTFSNIGTGGLGSLAASTYLADDQDINQAELTYTEWETDLQMEIRCV